MKLVMRIALGCCVLVAITQFGCGGIGASSASTQSNSTAAAGSPQAIDLFPANLTIGQTGVVLTVNGANFSSHDVVLLNGATQSTAFVSASQLTASISPQATAQAATISVVVKNMDSGQTSNGLSLIISNQLQISTAALPNGEADESYSATLSVSGGVPPYQFSLASGSLPGGLAINSQTGVIAGIPGPSGNYSFGTSVIDSIAATAKANLAISVGAAKGSGSANSSYYGSGIGEDSLANTTLGPNGNKVSYRFQAKNSGLLRQARVYLIPDHAGYAAGTGGTISVTLNTDDGTSAHNPSSKVLATYVISNILSLASPARYFYVIQFPTAPTLTAGQLYHMVFTNVDPNPTVNYLSVDGSCQFTATTPVQPTIPDADAAILLSEAGGPWKPRAGFTPVYELDMVNGTSQGIGYMEVWASAPEPISGSRAVRETFTVSGTPKRVTSASIRVARVNGNEPLEVRLENANGVLIEQGNIPASSIPSSNSTSPQYAWATYTFSTTHTLEPGSTYHLDFEATSTAAYQVFPIRKGSAYGFSNTTYFPDGNAEFEENYSWTGWTMWGVSNRTDGDLQFYFTVAP